MANKGMKHTEGGWPGEIDVDDEAALTRFRKRREKGGKSKGSKAVLEPLGASVSRLGPVVQLGVKQNNTINIYEEYFDELLTDHSSEPPSAKGMAVLRDPCPVRRTAATIDWIPDGPTRIAVAYSVLQFQDPRLLQKTLPVNSYLWDVQKPNSPEATLTPDSPLCSLRFNPKNTDVLIGGSYNGLVCHFDRRSGNKPVAASQIETSHHDPVYDVVWTQSKTGTMCTSCSTDGNLLWWDTRRLTEPTRRVQLVDSESGKVLGASSMAYNSEAGPHKYLVGSEQGVVASVNTRSKKTPNGVSVFSGGPGKHHAPIYSIQRNPVHVKYFMTVGDWTARIWTEDLKTPIMTTKYHQSYLTAGCWSPTRPGVFFVARKDGVVDVWDYFFRQNEVAYSHKVCDESLASIAVSSSQNNNATTQLAAIGDDGGTVSLLELSDSLWKPQNNEKPAMAGMLEREFKREKNLLTLARDALKRQKRAEAEAKKEAADAGGPGGSMVEEELMKIEQTFVQLVKDE
jgi:dynein intermediate chain 2